MTDQKQGYGSILKTTSLFGGVQLFGILISIVRSKFAAILIGPTGFGILGLYTATTSMISSITNFGLATSAVKDLAKANATRSEIRVSIISYVIRRLVLITGLLGLLVTLIFSPWLSKVTFGNREYTFGFILISFTLLFDQISAGQRVVLQGLRRLKYLAYASLLGGLIGLFTSITLYYFWGLKGIVPSIIVTAVTTLFLTRYFVGKLQINPIKVTTTRLIAEGKGMLRLGFLLSLTGIIASGTAFILRTFINNNGGLNQVGLYNAGFAILNTYVGLIFSAMLTDYYPRLSEVSNNNALCKRIINQQSEVVILILAPLLISFIVFIKWIILLLYSNKFLEINLMLQWAALGMMFKSASWAISIIMLAKGDSKTIFFNELIANVYLLGLNMLSYLKWGITGLGISFLVGYLVYLFQVYLVARKRYEFSYDKSFMVIFTTQVCMVIMSFLIVLFASTKIEIVACTILLLFSAWFSGYEINKRVPIKGILVNLKNKYVRNSASLDD